MRNETIWKSDCPKSSIVSKGNPQTKKASTRGKIGIALGTTSSDWAAVKPFLISWSTRSEPDSMPKRSSTQPVAAIARIISSSTRFTRPKAFHCTLSPRRSNSSQNRITCGFPETKNSSWKRNRSTPAARCRNSISSTMFLGLRL